MLRALAALMLAAGVVAMLVGGTFTLQGLGLVGPSSSVMVGDRAWVVNGIAIAAAGAVLVLAGFAIRRARKRH